MIIKAWYGHLGDIELEEDDEDEELPEEIIDVSVVLQSLVNDSRVTVPGGHTKVNNNSNKKKQTIKQKGNLISKRTILTINLMIHVIIIVSVIRPISLAFMIHVLVNVNNCECYIDSNIVCIWSL